MKTNLYQATLCHDKGRFSMRLTASSTKNAITRITTLENCPPRAILSMSRIVKRGKQVESIPVVKNGEII
jgi:hypothetical protein